MSRPDGPLLVVGLGNILLRDEGVGVRVVGAVEALGPVVLPPGTRVVDGGTLGLDLLPLIEDARALLIVDAVDLRRPPGTIRLFHGDEIHSPLAGHLSPHQVGIGDLLAAARLRGTLPGPVALIGIQPAQIAIGLGLSEVVEAAVPAAVRTAVAELRILAASAVASGPILDRSVATAAMG